MFLSGYSQNYSVVEVELSSKEIKEVTVNQWTSIVIEQNHSWKDCYLILEEDTILLKEDHHEEKYHSQQIFSSNKHQLIKLLSNDSLSLKVHFFYIQPYSLMEKKVRLQQNCKEPSLVSIQEWRNKPTVLDPPLTKPVKTLVKHVVIHHSATSVLNTNYYNVVRNIYVYHTQSNGWDDIGYNYLIAPNGEIFEGRDAQKVDDTDNIRGAHMCNKNDSTMAICLLGDYTNVSPSIEMLLSLYQLTAWKLEKEGLDPFGKSLHSIGPTVAKLPSILLPHIVGHRDGCRSGYTACPGDKVYEMMDEIRQKVDLTLKNCVQSVFSKKENKNYQFNNKELVFSSSKETIFVYDVNGILKSQVENTSILDCSMYKQGVYFIRTINKKEVQLIKIVKI